MIEKYQKTTNVKVANCDAYIEVLRFKQVQKTDELLKLLDASKEARAQAEKARTELLAELRGTQAARADSDRRRKGAEQALQDALARQADADKQRQDATEALTRFQAIVWVL